MKGKRRHKENRPMLCARCRHYDGYADYCQQYRWPEGGGCRYFLHDRLERWPEELKLEKR